MFSLHMDDFSLELQQLVTQLLACAARDFSGHRIVTGRSMSKINPSSLQVILGDTSEPCPVLKGQANLVGILSHRDFIVPHPDLGPPVYRVSEGAMEWFRDTRTFTDDEVREEVGRYILCREKAQRGTLWEYKVDDVAKETGVDPTKVRYQTEYLMRAGFLRKVLPINRSDFGWVSFTEPEGLRWAAGGFSSIAYPPTTSVTVNLSLKQEIRIVIDQARTAEVPQELMDQYEARLRRLEEELEQPEGRYEAVKDLIETANQSKDLLGPTIPFLFKHWDKIERWLSTATNAAQNLT